MDYFKLTLIVFIVVATVGVLLGMYLSKYCEPANDEEYEEGLYKGGNDDRNTTENK